MDEIAPPAAIRVSLLWPQYVEALGIVIQRCSNREPAGRVRLWAYGKLLTVFVSLREGVVVTRDAILSDSFAIDVELSCEDFRQSLLRSFNEGVAHVDVPVGPVTFAIPWGEITPLGFVARADAIQVVTAGENILADTAAQAGGNPDPRALEDLYEVLLEDIVFRVPDLDGSECAIPLKALWVGAGLGLLAEESDVALQRQGEFVAAVFNFGNVWFHAPLAAPSPQVLAPNDYPDSGLFVE